jgi:hypothetical protein
MTEQAAGRSVKICAFFSNQTGKKAVHVSTQEYEYVVAREETLSCRRLNRDQSTDLGRTMRLRPSEREDLLIESIMRRTKTAQKVSGTTVTMQYCVTLSENTSRDAVRALRPYPLGYPTSAILFRSALANVQLAFPGLITLIRHTSHPENGRSNPFPEPPLYSVLLAQL